MSQVIQVTQQAFEKEVEQYQGTVLIDFYAPWCAPCKMIAPLIDQFSEEKEEIKVVKVNSDEAPELMSKLGIRGIPTLLLIKDGELIDRKVGAINYQQLKDFATT